MKKSVLAAMACLTGLAWASVGPYGGLNLIKNGGFDDLPYAGGWPWYGVDDDGVFADGAHTTVVSHWAGRGGWGISVRQANNGPWVGNALWGNYCGNVQGPGRCYQKVTVPVEGDYRLSFWYAGRPGYLGATLNVYVGDALVVSHVAQSTSFAFSSSTVHLLPGEQLVQFEAQHEGGHSVALDEVALEIPDASNTAGCNLVKNASFEFTDLNSDWIYLTSRNIGYWFADVPDRVGVTFGRGPWVQAPALPDGKICCYVQANDEGSGTIRQLVAVPYDGPYDLTFQYAGRNDGSAVLGAIIHVFIDDVEIGTYQATGTGFARGTLRPVLTAGQHWLRFAGDNGGSGDKTFLLDQVVLRPAEEGRNLVVNGDFETAQIPSNRGIWGYFSHGVELPGWSGGNVRTGVTQAFESPWVQANHLPSGSHAAILQDDEEDSWLQQEINVPQAGTYRLSFAYAARIEGDAARPGLVVHAYLGETLVGSVTATDTEFSGAGFTAELPAGPVVLRFVGDREGSAEDRTALLDDVRLARIGDEQGNYTLGTYGGENVVGNPSFENNTTIGSQNGSWQYFQSGVTTEGWTGGGSRAGLATVASPWMNNNAPNGCFAALVQMDEPDSYLQRTVVVPETGDYILSLNVAKRYGYLAGQTLTVSLDEREVGTLTMYEDAYTLRAFVVRGLEAGTYTLRLTGGVLASVAGADVSGTVDVVNLERTEATALAWRSAAASDAVIRSTDNVWYRAGAARLVAFPQGADMVLDGGEDGTATFLTAEDVAARTLTIRGSRAYAVQCAPSFTVAETVTMAGTETVKLTGTMPAATFVVNAGTLAFPAGVKTEGTITIAEGAKLFIDLNDLDGVEDGVVLSCGGLVLPEGVDLADWRRYVALSNDNLEAELSDDAKTITLAGDDPVWAVWTNATGTGNLADPANWICKKVNGEVVADAVPTQKTVVHVTGATDLQLTPSNVLQIKAGGYAFEDEIRLTADVDWTGVDVVLLNGATLDVGSFACKVRSIAAESAAGAKVTTSYVPPENGTPGQLVVDVPEGAEFVNDSVRLTGALCVKKLGKGTYVPHLEGQDFTGGTDIVEGTFRGCPPYHANTQQQVFIRKDATFDIAGVGERYNVIYWLDGGRIVNSGAPLPEAATCFGDIWLLQDSTIDASSQMGFLRPSWRTCLLKLDGHTLTVELPNANNRFMLPNVRMTAGTIKTKGVERLSFNTVPADGGDLVTFDLETPMECAGNVPMANYICRYNGPLGYGAGWNLVTGTFCPVGDSFWGTMLKNNATLDLSQRTTPLNTESTITTGYYVLAFDAEAQVINVQLGAREFAAPEVCLIAWKEKPEGIQWNVTGVHAFKRHVLDVRDDGLYLVPQPCTVILFR